MRRLLPLLALLALAPPLLAAGAADDRLTAATFAGLELRAIGPDRKSVV